jgi:hypothetical protein
MTWGTGATVGRHGAAGTGPKLTCAGGDTRSCARLGRSGAEERATAAIPGGLNLIQTQIQTDSNHLNF